MSEAVFKLDVGAVNRVRREFLGPLAEGSARILVNEIKLSMEEAPPRSGRVYLVPGTKTPYVASAPGEPPAIRTGAYRDSWAPTPAVVQGESAVAAATSALRDDDGELLGLKLEFGGGNPPIAPRPHIRRAIETAKPKVLAFLARFRNAA